MQLYLDAVSIESTWNYLYFLIYNRITLDIFVTILRIHLLIPILERLYLHTNTWRLVAERARRKEKKVPDPVPLYTGVVPLNQLTWVWVPCLSKNYRFRSLTLYAYIFDKLFKLFLQIHSTVTVSVGSGVQPWEKHGVCPLHFIKSAMWGTSQSRCFYSSAVKCTHSPYCRTRSLSVCVWGRPLCEKSLFHWS